jgi:hypothetical protein
MATLYHYTSMNALALIARDRALKPFVYGNDKLRGAGVYCMAEDVGTPWMAKPDAATTRGAARADKRLVRFAVRVPDEDAHTLNYDRSKFDAEEWRMVALLRVVRRAVPEAEWLDVSYRAHPGARWKPIPIPIPL